MTIRSRLLMWLLPVLIAFLGLISSFFYLNWYWDIMSSFQAHLQNVVVSSSELFDPQDIAWINQHRHDPDLKNSEPYRRAYEKLWHLEEKMPITDLFILAIEPVKKGETVLLDQPTSETNKVYDGVDKNYAYREIYLLDVAVRSQQASYDPGHYDFTESQEHTVYFTKEPFVSNIYQARSTEGRYMTGYAPILDSSGNVVALVAADIAMDVVDSRINNAFVVIVLSAVTAIFLGMAIVFFIANKISQPVKTLKNAALSIAAGQYGETIQVKGPQEIVELANTFNTMSECLEEHMTRLRESSLARERMYGEYECSQLIQYHMLQKVIDEWDDPRFEMRLVKEVSAAPSYGMLMKVGSTEAGTVDLMLTEAREKGFLGIYDLMTHGASLQEDSYPMIQASIGSKLVFKETEMPAPIVWSTQTRTFLSGEGHEWPLHVGDLVLFCNRAFYKQFPNEKAIQDWLGKSMRHFGGESLDSFRTILSHELNFLANKRNIEQDLYILCLKIKV